MDGVKYIREQLNDRFIKRNAYVIGEMQQHYKEHGRPDHIAGRMKLVLQLFVKYAVLKKNPVRIKQKRSEKQPYPESRDGRQTSERELSERIGKADVIVFDLWNVLVYSALDSRYLLALFETATGCPGISEYVDFNPLADKDQRRRIEEISLDFCLDNTYMHIIWDRAKAMGKSVYLYNNSGFTDTFIRKVAEKFAYEGEIYHGSRCKGLHITTDSKGQTGIRYRNVNELGDRYRPFYRTNVVTDFYNRIVNLKFHAGQSPQTIFYEYGFTCGGILTCGFCQYLNELVEQKEIDKLLFVSRDGDIMKKVYDRYYRKCDTAYLFFSRFASYEIIFRDFPEEYIDKNIRTRMQGGGKCTVGEILQECGLTCLEKYLEGQGMSAAENLDGSNYRQFRQFLLDYKDRIEEEFHDSETAAKRYFMQEIQGYRSVCVVDLGWRGTSAVYLRHLFQKKYGWEGCVTGALIGAAMDDVTQTYVREGTLYAYAFDSVFYRRTGAGNGEYMTQEELFCIEALFSAGEPALLRYRTDEGGKTGFIYGSRNPNREMTAEIQKGIMDYAEKCAPLLQKYHLRILARDAYTPLDFCMHNRRYRRLICQAYTEEKDALEGFRYPRGD